jgi:hypothetical protein
MNITRRLALTGASAFAFTGGVVQSGLASVSKSLAEGRAFRNTQTSQRFLELLIHRDESGRQPYSAEVSIIAPDTAWYSVDTLDDTKYRLSNNGFKKKGYRLRRVSAFKTREGVRYSACWEFASGPKWHSRHDMSAAEFTSADAKFAKNGFRLSYLDTRTRYSAVWEKGDRSAQRILADVSQSQFEQQYATFVSQGLRPFRISVVAENGAANFAAIFDQGAGNSWQSYHQLSATDFRKTDTKMKTQGYRLTDASGYMLGHKPMFAGIWEAI